MATMAAMPAARQPFAELGASRLQSLCSAKNRQNAVTEMLAFQGKEKPLNQLNSPTKRPYTPTIFNDDGELDVENIDPALFSSKKSKGHDGTPNKKLVEPLFQLSTDFGISPSTTLPSKPYTPSPSLHSSSSSGVTPMAYDKPSPTYSAPAGRSPKHKRVGILSRKRTSLSPFKRIDPPSFLHNKSTNVSSGLPFSIDAALSGTLSNYAPAPAVAKPKVHTLGESMPKGWFFNIHEDSPDEEAANLMEHSTCILDISSDDEEGSSTKRNERGKENIPPPDHASLDRSNQSRSYAKPRRSVHADAMVDVDVERSPLGDLPAEDFYEAGLDRHSVEILAVENDKLHDSSTSNIEIVADNYQVKVTLTEEPSPSATPSAPVDVSAVDTSVPTTIKEELVVVEDAAIATQAGQVEPISITSPADFIIAEDPNIQL